MTWPRSEGRPFRFPEGFLWGAATAAHQVEGGNVWNDWWEWEQAGRLPFRSGEACRHFDLYERDFDLAHSMGHNAHRFSIEWSRIEPRPGAWNRDAVEHYRRVVGALRARGMEPLVTLHHFTNPAWFARRGGWLRRDGADLFLRYVEFIAANLQADVRYWITINEPTVYAINAFVKGQFPPCGRGGWLRAIRVLRTMSKAHVGAYRIIKRRSPDSLVGLAHSAPFVVPCDPDRAPDRACAWSRDFILNRLCFSFMGAPRRVPFDFLGVNYYNRSIVRWRPRWPAALFGAECLENHHGEPRRFNDLGWEIYPPGLTRVLEKFARFGVPLMITENGVAIGDEDARTAFLADHLHALARAIEAGVDVTGYFHWTLMDNFEWALGTTARFGLAANDFETQERQPRACARYFESVCRTNEVSVPALGPGRAGPAGSDRTGIHETLIRE